MTTAETCTRETQVLIVGGGPTGLCASIALSRFGVSSLLVERHPSISPFPRTRAVHRRSLEIFRRRGLEESVRAVELDLEPVMVWAESFTAPALRRQDHVPRFNPDLSPCSMANIFQHDLEPLLLGRATRERVAEIRFSTELKSLDNAADGVEALIKERDTEVQGRVRARYLIAAHGVFSTHRERHSGAGNGAA
jgi:putative polyketide hydroxylase